MDTEAKIRCPKCRTHHVPERNISPGHLYQIVCLNCQETFKFRSVEPMKDFVSFIVNGKPYNVQNDADIEMTLAEFLREKLGLKGTKVMCKEGGCGSCIVSASFYDQTKGKPCVVSVNSCLTPVLSCDGWDIETIEGIGNRKIGYHPIQKRLADYSGTQCGFCSPGMVMSMFSLMVDGKPKEAEIIEKNFDGNICRCTGYRSILDCMKSFADGQGMASDIEDLFQKDKSCCENVNSCKKDGACGNECKESTKTIMLPLNGGVWYKPASLDEAYNIVEQFKNKKIRFVVGNTATGIYKQDGPYDVYIDTKGIKELYELSVGDSISAGANVSLNQLKVLLSDAASNQDFAYGSVLAQHIQKIANMPVRNVGSWAGNLMIKFHHPEFISDIFIILAAAGASLTIASKSGTSNINVEDLPTTNMTNKIILKMTINPWKVSPSSEKRLMTYKIMPRSQNAHAYVNAGFCITLDRNSCTVEGTPTIIFGGISERFLHAAKTEKFLMNKNMDDPSIISEALKLCAAEVVPDANPVLANPKFRKDLAVTLFYKFILNVLGEKLPPILKSGMQNLERPLSSGQQDFSTDKTQWPLTEPMPKVTAVNQTSGETEFVSDIPTAVGLLFAAFVVSTVGNAKIDAIDPSEALKLDGVQRFVSYKDIPKGGFNNFVPTEFDNVHTEEIFCSGQVLYAGQGIGLIIADNQRQADEAALKVKITYSQIQPPVTDINEAIEKQMFFPKPCNDIIVGDADSAIKASNKIITGEVRMGTQYHFTMETQDCLCTPKENQMEVFSSTQWPAGVQSAIGQVLGIPSSKIAVRVRRLGGGYGSKLSRNMYVSSACAVAAYVMDKPVKLVLNFNTNMEMIGKRYPYLAKYEVGTTEEGKLNGVKITYYADHGCSASDSTSSVTLIFSDNVYHCANWHLTPVAVRTNTPSNTWCRSPGSTPGTFIIETIMEHVAQAVGRNAMDVKVMNFYSKGQVTPYNQPLPNCNISELVEQIKKTAEVEQRLSTIQLFNKENRWKKKGISFVPIKFGIAWNGSFFNGILSIYAHDGSVAIMHGGIEMGQGINTKAIQVCARALQIPIEMITVRPTEDLSAANSSMSGGSITSEMCCIGVEECCKILQERIAPVKSKMPSAKWEDVIQQCYKEGVDLVARYFVNPKLQPPKQPFTYNTYGVTVAEVELDVLTGENQINRVDVLYDCGESKNPDIDIGQIEGAVTMGIGYWLLEQTKYDPESGRNLTNGTWEYKPPTTLDIPIDFRIQLLKNSTNPVKVIRSKAVAEPPLCMSSAVLFALKNAISEARKECGNDDFVAVGPPTTVEIAQQLCLPDISQYRIK